MDQDDDVILVEDFKESNLKTKQVPECGGGMNIRMDDAQRWLHFKDIFSKQEIDLLIDHNYAMTLEFDIIKEKAYEKEVMQVKELDHHESNTAIENESILKSYLSNFDNANGLEVITLKDENDVRCIICNETLEGPALLTNHLKLHEGNIETQKFGMCTDTFESRLEDYSVIQTKEEFHNCKECGKAFVEEKNLETHLKYFHHTDLPKLFQCDYCEESFSSTYFLSKHSKITHADKNYRKKNLLKKFQCDLCPKTFVRNNDLIRHSFIHCPKEFKCENCEESFALERNLLHHLATHSKEIFKCDKCNKEFLCENFLKIHKCARAKEKFLKCDVCSKKFKKKWCLDKHSASHTVVELPGDFIEEKIRIESRQKKIETLKQFLGE